MKTISGYLTFLIILSMMACKNNSQEKSADIIQSELEWFRNGPWQEGLEMRPDASVDINEFYRQYQLNQSLWDQAFALMRESDLSRLEKGTYELAADSLILIVDEYLTKEEKDARYEAHRKYADIQYLISGSERIGIVKLQDPPILEPYDEVKDIAFYDIREDHFRVADQQHFFVFFPEDAHRPCISNGEPQEVKKIVFKVRMN
jgi:YhcH/YjgK/YiaL family protein